ncbi:MAG: serine/threonine protein kinase [Gomphosphaeria aponina SAG 52.96 = DSM 107014]|uniref:non-specific serine/threonine protein kinase n=1 Tax=Gomphosphaeria aponina SAG 52.96 = DSM 107014 TaxID=1521640 RepID=A0A941JT50_9CHRO|nr:serine/threonine protein kinase [Gomphosphaeria aponina SAG 52.96 = DSM 107014]
MKILCTRLGCLNSHNSFPELDDPTRLQTAQQKFCTSCGMPLILAGRYLPSRLLGKGGFGAAFLAVDRFTPTMRQCVVKQFQPEGNLTAEQLKIAQDLFVREATVLERLGNKHRQIPDLYAFFPVVVPSQNGQREEQYFYLVQEFIDGQNLAQELTAKGKLSEAEVLEVLAQMLHILKFVHGNGSIHRDIKPSNIMRDSSGVLYLLDFGAVKEVAAGSKGRSTGIYSAGFAPPEQMSGAEVYPSTDLYSLAATCLELLTGKEIIELYDAYNNKWNWRNYAPQVGERLAQIFERMLSRTPLDRFQSAEEVLHALDSSLSPQTPQPPQPPQPPKPRFSLLEILGGAAFVGTMGALLFIVFTSIFSAPGISIGLWGMCNSGLIFALYRRVMEKIDLIIITAIALGLVLFIPALHGSFSSQLVLVISVLAAAGAIAATALFRLIYQLLSRLL